ncbi:MAG TPA: PASTA domain-containing protein [Solirubrobacteraceae bacterium]|nr:PASTA domain-containing protein [Solirubrobacteraceae bacterium]
MTDRTAVPERVSERAKTARRGAGSGSQVVGDYVGQPAGEAAQAVRRAGLRPGLDRSFGCPAQLVGLVVAQDPAGGNELARNGMVTLYVAAPGGEQTNSDGDGAPVRSGEPGDGLTVEAPIEEEPSTRPATPVRARRRKPGHARHSSAPKETQPSPAAIESPLEDAPARAIVEPQAVWPTVADPPEGALENETADEQSGHGFPHEDFVVHVEDVLAGRSSLPGWRRTYPRRRLGEQGRLRAWLGEHRLIACVVGFALVLWIVVGVASTLDGHHGRTSQAITGASGRFAGADHPSAASKPTTPKKLSAHKTVARPPRPRPRPRERQGAPRRRAAAARRRVRSASPAVSESVAPAPDKAPAPQAAGPSASAPVAPEQGGGGLFSP